MRKWLHFEIAILLFAVTTSLFESCKKQQDVSKDLALNSEFTNQPIKESAKKPLSEHFKKYWYAGEAEITSYKLEQARYGEIREGEAVLIFVTEPFLPKVQVKANGNSAENIQVLKLNATKKYLTGIYPYSIMSSTFYPVHDNQHAIKTSFSAQEWCGQVYSQLNNREEFEFTSHSYFEGEADEQRTMKKSILENELWNKIRINPQGLPVGELSIVPSLEFIRLKHAEAKAYKALASSSEIEGMKSYTIEYPELGRTLKINYSAEFPYEIEGWSEEFKSGYGPNAKLLTSKATRIKKLKTPYWKQNSNKYLPLRDSLGLKS